MIDRVWIINNWYCCVACNSRLDVLRETHLFKTARLGRGMSDVPREVVHHRSLSFHLSFFSSRFWKSVKHLEMKYRATCHVLNVAPSLNVNLYQVSARSAMGGVQSGTHNLGEALWVQERQRQKCHRWVASFLIIHEQRAIHFVHETGDRYARRQSSNENVNALYLDAVLEKEMISSVVRWMKVELFFLEEFRITQVVEKNLQRDVLKTTKRRLRK